MVLLLQILMGQFGARTTKMGSDAISLMIKLNSTKSKAQKIVFNKKFLLLKMNFQLIVKLLWLSGYTRSTWAISILTLF